MYLFTQHAWMFLRFLSGLHKKSRWMKRSCHFLDTSVGFSFIIHETSANLFWELRCFSFLNKNWVKDNCRIFSPLYYFFLIKIGLEKKINTLFYIFFIQWWITSFLRSPQNCNFGFWHVFLVSVYLPNLPLHFIYT